ncbi:hypothetical protein AWT69_002029 [Pseudomonas putida]|nr:hypothetical protein AWT69_002029 [Pseudomonas putida]
MPRFAMETPSAPWPGPVWQRIDPGPEARCKVFFKRAVIKLIR